MKKRNQTMKEFKKDLSEFESLPEKEDVFLHYQYDSKDESLARYFVYIESGIAVIPICSMVQRKVNIMQENVHMFGINDLDTLQVFKNQAKKDIRTLENALKNQELIPEKMNEWILPFDETIHRLKEENIISEREIDGNTTLRYTVVYAPDSYQLGFILIQCTEGLGMIYFNESDSTTGFEQLFLDTWTFVGNEETKFLEEALKKRYQELKNIEFIEKKQRLRKLLYNK